MEQRTLEKLKNFANINKTILIREGNIIRTSNPENTLIARTVVNDNFDREFGIYDLPKFLTAVNMFDNSKIEFEEESIKIQSKEGDVIDFYYSDPRFIKSVPNREIVLPPTLMKFDISQEELQKILKVSSVMKLTNLYISKNGIVAKNPDGVGDQYTTPIENFEVYDECGDDEIFDINIDIMKFIPDDYTVYVTEVVLKFESKNDAMEYYVSLNE